VGSAGQHRVSQERFGARQHLSDIRYELARIQQVGNPGQTFGCDGYEKKHAVDAVSRGLGLIGHADRRHEDAPGLENFERSVEDLAADRVNSA
jgi:hypothetical protein